MPTIAIDFGTSNSQIAYLDSMGRAVSLQVDGYTKIPTELYYREKQDEIFIGLSAKELYEQDKLLAEAAGGNVEQTKTLLSANRLTAFKKEFCRAEVSFDDFARTLCHRGGRPFTWGEVVTAFFSFFKKEAEEHLFPGETIDSVRLTHPVHFPSCELYRRAAEAAGFTSVTMIPEPEAAYSGYMQGGKPLGDTILVFDMGGGTLDLAVLEKRGEKWLVERQPLRIDIAGLDIDIAILRKILPQIQESDTALSRVGADYTLLDAVRENIKEKWSRTERDVSFSYFFSQQNKRFHCTVPHDTMLPLVRKMMQPAYDKMRTYLVELGCVPTDVLMVGGSCLMPEIQRGVQQCMGNKVRVFTPNLGDTIVAEGAMLCELHEEGHHSIEPFEAKKIYHGDIIDISYDFRVIIEKREDYATCYELYHSGYTQQLEKRELQKNIYSVGQDSTIKASLSDDGLGLLVHNKEDQICKVRQYNMLDTSFRYCKTISPLDVATISSRNHLCAFAKDFNKILIISYNDNMLSRSFSIFSEEERNDIEKELQQRMEIHKQIKKDASKILLKSFFLSGDPFKIAQASRIVFSANKVSNNYGCSSLQFSHDGAWLAATYKTLHERGVCIYKIDDNQGNAILHNYSLYTPKVEFSGDSSMLIVTHKGKIIFIDLHTGQIAEEWEPAANDTLPLIHLSGDCTEERLINNFSCSPDTRYIAISTSSESLTPKIVIVEKNTGRVCTTISPTHTPHFLRFSADGSMMATDEGIWDVSPLLA